MWRLPTPEQALARRIYSRFVLKKATLNARNESVFLSCGRIKKRRKLNLPYERL